MTDDSEERTSIERVADEMDKASAMELMFTEAAIYAVQHLAKPEKHPDFDGVHCLDCEEEIPAERLAMCRIRCVACQTDIEVADKRRGHNFFF